MQQENKLKKSTRRAKAREVYVVLKKVIRESLRYFSEIVGGVFDSFFLLISEGRKTKKFRRLAKILTLGAFSFVILCAGVISLAKFPLSVYPAGFALLSAIGGTGKIRFRRIGEKNARLLDTAFLLAAFLGVMISPVFLGKYGIFYLLSYMILFLFRAWRTGGKFDDTILFRVTVSSAVATALGILLACLDSFSVNRVFGAVSVGVLTPILTYLLCGFYIFTAVTDQDGTPQSRRRVYLEASIFTLFYLFLFALKEIQISGFSLSFVLAVMATLLVSKQKGALFGAAAGMIGGMACASSAAAPALAVGGFFSGLFFEYSGAVALMIAFVSSCGYCLFSEGLSGFAYFTADYLCAILLISPLLRLFPKEKALPVRSAPREVIHRETMRRTRQKLKNMSDAFSSLSEVFYTVSDTMKKPGLTETSRLVSDCCSQICSRCALSGICWGNQQKLSANVTTGVAARLLSDGAVSSLDFAKPFSGQCNHLDQLVELINHRFSELNASDVKNHKTRLLAGEYSSVSRLLKSTAGELDRELEYNPALENRAKKVLAELGILYRRVAIFGNRELRIDVYGIALERVSLASDEVLTAFGNEFSCVFDAPDFLMFEESVVMRLTRKRKIALECAKSGCTKKGEAVSGDSCLFFETQRDYFYALICDGMGSGREAAFTSRLSSIFIEKLMHCATPKNVTLEMLNTFLMAKTDETFSTVDLLEVDLFSGDANFIKAGAAPSFILRGDRLHRIESRTPPAGALYRMCAEQTTFSLREGDFVIQMSDGAEGTAEGAGWLIRLLSGASFDSAAVLCDRIFEKAKEKGNFRDDLSVCVVKIMNNK